MTKARYFLPSIYLHPLKKIYAEHYIDPVRMLSIVGLPPSTLHAKNLEIDHVKYVELVNESAKKCQEPLMGFLIGREFHLDNIGHLGLLLSHQQVLSGIYPVVFYMFNSQKRGARHYLEIKGNKAFHYVEFLIEDQVDCSQAAMLTVCAYHNFFFEIIGDRWQPEKVYLQIPKPPGGEMVERYFGCPVYFGEQLNAIEFDSSLVYEKSDESLKGSAKERKEINLALKHIPNLDEFVICYIKYFLLEKRPSKDEVAFSLGVNAKSLQALLSEKGLTYHELLERCLFDKAKHFLNTTDLAISNIALELGYSESRAFIRAFKRWSGMTPLKWRHQDNSIID